MRLCKSCRRSCQNPSKSLQNSVQNLRNPIFPQNLRQNSHLCKTCSQSCAGSVPAAIPAKNQMAWHSSCGETCNSQDLRRNMRFLCGTTAILSAKPAMSLLTLMVLQDLLQLLQSASPVTDSSASFASFTASFAAGLSLSNTFSKHCNPKSLLPVSVSLLSLF